MLAIHIQKQQTLSLNDKVYSLKIENKNAAFDALCLTDVANNDELALFICLEDSGIITFDVCNIAFANRKIVDENSDIQSIENEEFYYMSDKSLLPKSEAECKIFIYDLFNTYIVDIFNNKNIYSHHIHDENDGHYKVF